MWPEFAFKKMRVREEKAMVITIIVFLTFHLIAQILIIFCHLERYTFPGDVFSASLLAGLLVTMSLTRLLYN